MGNDAPSILIAGCGYVGRRLGEVLMEQGWNVIGLSRSESSVAELIKEGWTAHAVDISKADEIQKLAATGVKLDFMIHCAASGRGGGEAEYAAVYQGGCTNLLSAFPGVPLFFTSSTSVYPQIDGSVITETSEANPTRGTGKILRDTEATVLAANGTVLRLAGIYGPGRSVLLRNFLEGKSVIDVRTQPPETPDGRWINQVNREDIVGAISHLLSLSSTLLEGQTYNVSDSRPLTQREVYVELARRFDMPMPSESVPDESRKRGWTHKRVSNGKLLATGWKPKFPDYFTALDEGRLLP